MRFLALLTFLACFAVSAAPVQAQTYLHNGSVMTAYYDGEDSLRIVYEHPRAGLGVAPGTLLFSGAATANGHIHGTAYVFASGCRPFPYKVEGSYQDGNIVLQGFAPVPRRIGCWSPGFEQNQNSTLYFQSLPGTNRE